MADWGKGLSSAASGAATGAALGSVVPVLGNIAGGVIGGVGGLLGGLFGGGDDPKYNAPTLDASTQNSLNHSKDVASRSAEDWAGINNQGMEGAAGNMLPSTQQLQHESAALGGVGGDSMSQAIQNKSKKYFDSDMQTQKNAGYASGFDQQTKAQDAYNQLNNRKHQIETAIAQKTYTAQMQYQSSRNQVISSLFSGAGSVFGAMAAKGPGGPAPMKGSDYMAMDQEANGG